MWLALMGPAAAAAENAEEMVVDMAVPQILSWVPPTYPKEALDREREGWAQVRLIIDETGTVTKARAVESSDRIFEDAAVQSVVQWRFEPAMSDGRKVAKCVDLTLPFTMKGLKRHAAPSLPPAEVMQSLAYSPYTPVAKTAGDDPDYPDSLLFRHLPGEVIVKLSVDSEGRAQGLKILAATHADFIRPALDAAEHWSFQPARQGDLPVAASLAAALDFAVFDHKRVDVLALNGVTFTPEQAGDMSTLDVWPSLLAVVDPVYPYDLLLRGTTGEASADFVINARGFPESVVVREATQPEFGWAVRAALACWQFDPARRAGQAVPIKASFRWKFGLTANPGADQPVTRLVGRLREGDTSDMLAKGLDGRLTPRYQAPPVYPPELAEQKPPGRAEIAFIIDREGRGRLARIVSASREEFGWAAATAVERWVFNPPKRRGQPVDVRVSIPFEFKPPG